MPDPILVLGSTGRVGRAVRACWPADVPVIWQTRHPTKNPDHLTWDILQSQPPHLPKISGIVVLAGVTGGANLDQNTALAHAAARFGVRVLLTSTQAVYGTPDIVVSEGDAPVPITPYGKAKLAMEHAVAAYRHVVCLRLANVIGCDGLAAAMARGPVALDQFADGQGPRRMVIAPKAFADVLCKLMSHPDPLPPVINVAQPGLVSMQSILTAAGTAWHWRPAPADALAQLEMDVTLLQHYVPDLAPWIAPS